MASRTSVTSENITVAPARTSRSEAKPTAGFQRVLQRAAIHVQSSGREEVTGANILVAIFSERESHAVYQAQGSDHQPVQRPIGRAVAFEVPAVVRDDIVP